MRSAWSREPYTFPEHVPKSQVASEFFGQGCIYRRRAHTRNLEAHVRDDLAMPLLALGHAAVELFGDADEHSFDATVEVVQNRAPGA